ncbi:serine O-acetyltransferase [Flagellimonas sp. S3867]|uniref:serine O-acetyltransferase n=1 Tax=Flagellimonas sp. S3867 TaxID=2768063 RepID=UPI0016834F9F|nr:serine acetyltransferase [Flagellimonas sp. S3867]
MITSRKLYKEYLDKDRHALGMSNLNFLQKLRLIVVANYIYKFQKLLRKVEYVGNTKTTKWGDMRYYFLRFRYKRLSLRLGFTIPENVFGPGLSIAHYGTIIVNQNARIGKNCRIHACVNIGASGGSSKAPQLGDNIYIAPGAKIYGDIVLANNIAIGANAVVNKSFDEEHILVAGNPAKKIKEIDIKRIIKHV